MWPPGPPIWKPFDKTLTASPEDTVPILQDWLGSHDVLQAVKRQDRIDAVIGKRDPLDPAFDEIDSHSRRYRRPGLRLAASLDRIGREVDANHAKRCLVPDKIER